MTEPLGLDINGRPLRAGDEVVVVSAEEPDLAYMVGDVYTFIGIDADGGMMIDATSYDGYEIGVYSHNIRKLDNHQPAGSFDEVMAGLKQKETNDANVHN